MQHSALSLCLRWLERPCGASRAALLCLGLALAAPGCRPAQPPPALATGERPVTGVERYDAFFAELSAARTTVEEAREEEIDARRALARRVGLPEAAPIDVIGARLRERTARWADEGLTLELEFTGIEDVDGVEAPPEAGSSEEPAGAEAAAITAPSATLRTPGREPQPRELRLLEALAQAALSGATAYAHMGRAQRRVESLEAELAELRARLDTAFSDPTERDRVADKLDEAAEFLPALKGRAREVGGSADALISVLEEAANTVPVVASRRRPAPPGGKPASPALPPGPAAPPEKPAASPARPSTAASPGTPPSAAPTSPPAPSAAAPAPATPAPRAP